MLGCPLDMQAEEPGVVQIATRALASEEDALPFMSVAMPAPYRAGWLVLGESCVQLDPSQSQVSFIVARAISLGVQGRPLGGASASAAFSASPMSGSWSLTKWPNENDEAVVHE